MPAPSPEKILRYAAGAWQCGIVAAAVRLGLFQLIERGVDGAAAIAGATGMELRAAQALLDGLVGLELVVRDGEHYRTTPEASHFLVPDRADYLGTFVELGATDMAAWSRLAEVALTGEPVLAAFEPQGHAAWEPVVLGIAPLALAAARAAAVRLDIEEAPAFRMLDVGGGAGAFAAVWLALHPDAVATQLNRPNVNRVARDYVARFGVAERFTTVDGDARATDFGEARYEYAVASQLAHFFAPEENAALFARIKRALRPGGVLVIADFILDAERRGDPWALWFGANMLLSTRDGRCYQRSDFAAWLAAAGFDEIMVEALPGMPHSLLYAR